MPRAGILGKDRMRSAPQLILIVLAAMITITSILWPRARFGVAPSSGEELCSQQECVYFELLDEALAKSRFQMLVRFNPPCRPCGQATSLKELQPLPAGNDLRSKDTHELARMLVDRKSYLLGGAQKAMRFLADYALLINDDTVLLLSRSSKSARLLRRQESYRDVTVNIDPIADHLFAIIAGLVMQ